MTGSEATRAEGGDEWLVVIDPQAIFASPDSAWGSPFFAETMKYEPSLAPVGLRIHVCAVEPLAAYCQTLVPGLMPARARSMTPPVPVWKT